MIIRILVLIVFSMSTLFAQVTQFVNPMIGTGGHGHTFPGPTLPFGMVQLSPDTRIEGWDACSGYHYSDSSILGFSHTHLSGTGIADYCDVLIMPGTQVISSQMDLEKITTASRFNKSSENAKAGYYEVYLQDPRIKVRLTTSLRTGIHEYTFESKNNNWVMIDLAHRDKIIHAQFSETKKIQITGQRLSSSWAREQHIYFSILFSEEIKEFFYSKDSLKLFCMFDKIKENKLLVQCSISSVDELGAKNNLQKEYVNNFNKAVKSSDIQWNKMLSRIEVKDNKVSNPNQKIIFYTALYHALIHPSLFQDVDGRYRGMDHIIHMGDVLHPRYTVFSLWDTYRAAHPLYQLVYPEYNLDFARTFMGQYRECGRLAVWELSGNETYCMIGNHSIPVLVNAFLNQGNNNALDKTEVIHAIESTFKKGYPNIQDFTNGFISMEDGAESVSKTLENSLDYGAYRMLKESNQKEEKFYQNLYNPTTGFFQAKQNQRFSKDFDPTEVNFNYTEANAWQYLFGAHHDIEGIIECFNRSAGIQKSGVRRNKIFNVKILEEKLDSLFGTSSNMSGRVQSDITGLIGQYAHGNEPSHHVSYLYNYCNRNDKTQNRVKEIIEKFYTNKPNGLCGNEDCGQMSAWYVFSCLGFYPVNPISSYYQPGLPQFESIEIKIPEKKKIEINASNPGHKKWVSQLLINGIDQHNEFKISAGDKLTFNYDSKDYLQIEKIVGKPNTFSPLPYINSGQQVFEDSTLVSFMNFSKSELEYSTDSSQRKILNYASPICIKEAGPLWFRNKSIPEGKWLKSEFVKKPNGYAISVNQKYDKQYSGGSDNALCDGIEGSLDFRDGKWQGYWGRDLEIYIKIVEPAKANLLSIRFLQDQGSWILLPSEISVYGSEDEINYNKIDLLVNDISQNTNSAIDHIFNFSKINGFKFIMLKVKNGGKLPPWHLAAGEDSWIFMDELKIK
ncbi:MAG: GH92 family glycosyl hydrolase [Saprospiraceae bacterium]